MNKNRTIYLVGLFIFTFILSAFVILPFFTDLVLAIVLAVILHPLYSYFLKKFGDRKVLSALLSLCVAVVCIFVPLFLIGAQIFNESQNLYTSVQSEGIGSWADELSQKITNIVPGSDFDLRAELGKSLGSVTTRVAGIISSAVSVGLSIFLILVSVFFFLKDGDYFRRSLIQLSPLDDSKDRELLDSVAVSINTIIRGTIFVAIIQAGIATLGFVIFGVPNPLLWGFVSGIAAVVPLLGTSIVIIPAALYLFWIGLIWQPIGLLLWGFLLVGLIDNFLKPYLYGKGFKIHSLIMLFAILGGLAAFGPIGFILGPIIIGLFASVLEMYRSEPKLVA